MKTLLLSIGFLFVIQSWSQVEKISDTTLLYLKFVDPEACDYPHNLAFFHTYEEYESLVYDVILSEDSLIATRTFYIMNYEKDSVKRKETIRIHFGESSDFRNIQWAEYTMIGFENYDTESKEYLDNWLIHFAQIDYVKERLYYRFQRDSYYAVMELTIGQPAIENIEFLQNLCYFYRSKNQNSTEFKITEKDE